MSVVGLSFFQMAPNCFSLKSNLFKRFWANLTPEVIEVLVTKRNDIHYPRPKVVSITQATELGTVYSVNEIEDLSRKAKNRGLKIHMDGARFANAVARIGCSPAELSWKAVVDVLCFGGTKNGIPIGEAVIFFDQELAKDFSWRVKQAGQLASKMRFMTAPWLGLLENGIWLRNASHANKMAQHLYKGFLQVKGIELLHPPKANCGQLRFCAVTSDLDRTLVSTRIEVLPIYCDRRLQIHVCMGYQ